MRDLTEKTVLDWSRQNPVKIKKRGNLGILLPKAPMSGTAAVKPRCVWPSNFELAGSKVISRRVWGR